MSFLQHPCGWVSSAGLFTSALLRFLFIMSIMFTMSIVHINKEESVAGPPALESGPAKL